LPSASVTAAAAGLIDGARFECRLLAVGFAAIAQAAFLHPERLPVAL
jgi:hypothetical protein